MFSRCKNRLKAFSLKLNWTSEKSIQKILPISHCNVFLFCFVFFVCLFVCLFVSLFFCLFFGFFVHLPNFRLTQVSLFKEICFTTLEKKTFLPSKQITWSPTSNKLTLLPFLLSFSSTTKIREEKMF